MQSEVMEQVADHLRFLGYKVSPNPGNDKNILLAEHPVKNNFLFKETHGVVRLISCFVEKKVAEIDRKGYLELINSLNLNSVLVRFYADYDNTLTCQAVFHGVYDKLSFGVFIEIWERGMDLRLKEEYSEICKYVE